jgi:hypothetical protein
VDGKSFEKLALEEKIALAFQKLLQIHNIKLDEIPDAHSVKHVLKELEKDFDLQAHFLMIAQNDTDNQDYIENV